jgi:hypothetical protein
VRNYLPIQAIFFVYVYIYYKYQDKCIYIFFMGYCYYCIQIVVNSTIIEVLLLLFLNIIPDNTHRLKNFKYNSIPTYARAFALY